MPDFIPDGLEKADVLQGIEDYKKRKEHRFADSTGYDLVYEGERFPPKAILGLAAARINGQPLKPGDFKGGKGSKCFRILKDLGFVVSAKRNPDWNRDELILALDFYQKHTPKIPEKTAPEIIALSSTLRALYARLGHELNDTYRNANAVYLKLMNLRRLDPDYEGVGMGRGGKEEKLVWDEFYFSPEKLSAVSKQIVDHIYSDSKLVPESGDDEGEEEAQEGRLLTKVHRYRERDTKLVKRKKAKFKKIEGRLFCEGCGFDFEKTYGLRGVDFIECHHTKPVSELGVGQVTHLDDLVLVCSNCHRMIHRKKPWLSMTELKTILPFSSGNK